MRITQRKRKDKGSAALRSYLSRVGSVRISRERLEIFQRDIDVPANRFTKVLQDLQDEGLLQFEKLDLLFVAERPSASVRHRCA